MTSQDSKILLALTNSKDVVGMTSYQLSQETRIGLTQINYRIVKLIEYGIIKVTEIDNKSKYSVHPALRSSDFIKSITSMIQSIADKIAILEPVTLDGIKCVLSLIIDKLDIEDQEENEYLNDPKVIEQTKLIKCFREELEVYAKNNNLSITNIKSWTENKISWMALNDKKCCCRPETRHCPCHEGLIEAKESTSKMCTCSIFKGN